MRTPCKMTNGGPYGLVKSFNMADIMIAIETFMKIRKLTAILNGYSCFDIVKDDMLLNCNI